MDVRIVITASKNLIITFILRGSEISEVKVEKRGVQRIAGSIFKGKVKRLAKSLDGAFLDIGLEKEAYLPFKELEAQGENVKKPEVGEPLIVQVKREPIEEKGAKVSGRLSIPGKYLIYLPNSEGVFISSRIASDDKREKYQKLLSDVLNGDGVIVRTSAEDVDDSKLKDELKGLRKRWKAIKSKADEVGQGLVYEEAPLFFQVIRDNWQDIKEIVVDDRDVWTELLGLIEDGFHELIDRVRYVKNISVFFKKYDLDRALTKLFTRYVWLRGGGYIVIEETEAMTVIDVNSGAGCGESLEENALQTNLEAAQEIAKQIKLRDLGGIIIIDFIDMKDKSSRDTLINRFKELFADEGTRVHIYGITQLGLLEMTRKKETPSVTKLLSSDCPFCKGRGYIKSPELVLYEIEKEIGYFKGRYMEIRVNPYLKERVEKLLEKNNMKSWVSIREECEVPLDYYEIFITG